MLVVISLETMIERTKGLSIDRLIDWLLSSAYSFPLERTKFPFVLWPAQQRGGKTNKKKSVVCGGTISRLFSFSVVFCIGGCIGGGLPLDYYIIRVLMGWGGESDLDLVQYLHPTYIVILYISV